MQFMNEHAARQHPPKNFDSFSRGKPKGFPDGVSVVYGVKDGKSMIQSIRFKSNKWSVKKAKKWLKEHKYRAGIEVASKKEKSWEEAKRETGWQKDLLEAWSKSVAEQVIKKINKGRK